MEKRDELANGALRELLLWLVGFRQRFRVNGTSMFPLLNHRDLVLVDPKAYQNASPCLGDIVLVQHPYRTGVYLIKRVTKVLENERYYLTGDNPAESTDSRSFGTVAHQRILGRVTARFLWGYLKCAFC